MNRFIRSLSLRPDSAHDPTHFPFCLPAVRTLGCLEFARGATFLVGENGSGKSTLLEAIALKVGLNPGGGSKNFRSNLRPSESELHAHLRLARGTRRERHAFFLRAETLFNTATEAEGYRYPSLHEMSHGEAFLWLVQHRFGAHGLYLLDEPESALSPMRQLALLARLHKLVADGSQFVIATHSPILMALPGATLYLLGAAGISTIAYEETEHYVVTRRFLHHPQAVLDELLTTPTDDE